MRRLCGLLIVLVFAAAGCGGTTGSVASGAASVVPGNAALFVALNTDTDSEQWRAVDEIAKRFVGERDLMRTVKEALRQQGLSWENDVEPAIGPEFDVASLALRSEEAVVMTQPRDKAKFDKLIRQAKDASGGGIFTAEIDDWVLLGPNQAAVDRFVQESKSAASTLAESSGFKDAMSNYPDDALLRVYLDGRRISDVVRQMLEPHERDELDTLGKLDWVAAGLSAGSDGVRLDMNVHGKAGPALTKFSMAKPFGTRLAHVVPRDALAYFAFHGAKGMLTNLEENPLFREDVPELHRYAGVLRNVESLLQGENALYVRPAAKGKIPEVTFVAEPAAGTNAMATLDRLIKRSRKELELPALPKPSRVAGLPARTIDFGDYKIHFANVGKRFVITTLPAGIRALEGNRPSLADDQDFKDALDSAGVPDKTQGFVYVSVKGGIDYAQRLSKTNIPEAVKQNLKPLRSVVEYAAAQPSELQVTFFLRIK